MTSRATRIATFFIVHPPLSSGLRSWLARIACRSRTSRTPGGVRGLHGASQCGAAGPRVTVRARPRTGFAAIFLAGLATACADAPIVDPVGSAEPDPSFDIEIRLWPGTVVSLTQRRRIEAAAERWERVLTTGLPDVRVSGAVGCGLGSPTADEVIDDLVIWVRVADVAALAESGPCLLRQGSLLPVTGTVWLDGPTRLDQLAPQFLQALVTHEIGHVLGFGTLWRQKGLLADPALNGGSDPHFVGSGARVWFDMLGGARYPGGKVPVEPTGGPGTADSHWRLSVFGDSELMSPTVVRGVNALSSITARSLADLGYEVDPDQADIWTLPPAGSGARARGGAAIPLDERLRSGPFIEIGPGGSRRILRR